MRKWSLKKFKINPIDMDQLEDRTLLLNLYITQMLTLLLAAIILFFQKNDIFQMLHWSHYHLILLWGGGFAAVFLATDLVLSRWVPEEVADDGGINDKLFAARPIWHILLISIVVAICEELLFRGAIQHAFGPYWTSILFAAIHVRYLRHWLMTGLVFSVSYGLGWIYLQTGTLWTPILSHLLIDFVMGCMIRYRRDR